MSEQTQPVGVASGKPARTATRRARPSQPSRLVERTLRLLAVLGEGRAHSLTTLSTLVQLPRTTVYRLVATFSTEGFATRCQDGTYVAGPAFLRLAHQTADGASILDFARPYADALSAEIGWPASVEAIAGAEVVTAYATDRYTASGVVHVRSGQRAPLLERPSGRLYLALLQPAARAANLDQLGVSAAAQLEFESEVPEIRNRGLASFQVHGARGERVAIAAPLYQPAHSMVGALVVRFPGGYVKRGGDPSRLAEALGRVAAQCQREFDRCHSADPDALEEGHRPAVFHPGAGVAQRRASGDHHSGVCHGEVQA